MKLIKLEIIGLHGCFNYSVDFNSDVTFIYGMNGCGKTTILNITEALITGRLYKLFKYDFDSIKLHYGKLAKSILKTNNRNMILIENKSDYLKVNFDNKEIKITNKLFFVERLSRSELETIDAYMEYFNEYPLLQKIERTFNYVYLPLNRMSYSHVHENFNNYYMPQKIRNRYDYERNIDTDEKDIAITNVEQLIYDYCYQMNNNISKINNKFRDEILKSLLEVNQQPISDILNEVLSERNSISDLSKTKSAYMKLLNDLDLLTKEEEDSYNLFFMNFISELSKMMSSKDTSFSYDLVTKFQEINKINKLLKIAKAAEGSKYKERKSLEVFLDTMNSFLAEDVDGKEFAVDNMGNVYFTTKYSEENISIHKLSSGEKQLVTFFANLIFGVQKGRSGIFVVDEPELSLHLNWQRQFVDRTLDINNNIQLVFATHSPEIIGRRRYKMYKLEKIYGGAEV